MSKWKKTGLIVLAVLLLSFLLPVIWDQLTLNKSVSILKWQFLMPQFLSQYLLWFAVGLSALLLIGILVVIFYPKDKQTFILQNGKDTLKIQKKAIEGLVDVHLNERDFVKKPQVKIRAVGNKMKIKIKGELKRTTDLIHRVDQFTENIKTDITNILGHGKDYIVQVDFSKIVPKEKEATRVE